MPLERLLPQQYMHLSKELRDKITEVFNIKRTGVSEVRDQDIITDGTTYDDLLVVTHRAMGEYVGSDETFARAWELTVAKAYSELHPPVGIIKATEPEVVKETVQEPEVINTIPESPNAKKETRKQK